MQDRCFVASFYNLHGGPSDFSQRLLCRGDLARDLSATPRHWVTEPGESGQVRVKGYLHFTGDGRLCHDYVTSPVTMSHRHTLVTSVRGPGGHKMVSSSHTRHMTLGSISVTPCVFIDSERFISTFNLIIWTLMISSYQIWTSLQMLTTRIRVILWDDAQLSRFQWKGQKMSWSICKGKQH